MEKFFHQRRSFTWLYVVGQKLKRGPRNDCKGGRFVPSVVLITVESSLKCEKLLNKLTDVIDICNFHNSCQNLLWNFRTKPHCSFKMKMFYGRRTFWLDLLYPSFLLSSFLSPFTILVDSFFEKVFFLPFVFVCSTPQAKSTFWV